MGLYWDIEGYIVLHKNIYIYIYTYVRSYSKMWFRLLSVQCFLVQLAGFRVQGSAFKPLVLDTG